MFSLITVKARKKEFKRAKIIKQLEKRKQQEAAENTKVEEHQSGKGKIIIIYSSFTVMLLP